MKDIVFVKENKRQILRIIAIILLMFVYQVLAVVVALPILQKYGQSSVISLTTMSALSALMMIGTFLAMHGKSFLAFDIKKIAETFRFGWWDIVVTLLTAGLALVQFIASNEYSINDKWPTEIPCLVIMFLSVGYSEELVFRGVVLQSLLAMFGSTKKGVWLSVILSCFLFGFVHVSISEMLTPMGLAQGIGKILQVGSWSFLLAVCVLKTKNLHGAALLHGFVDFCPTAVAVLFGESLDINYISDKPEDAVATVIVYFVFILLYIPFIVKSARWLNENAEPNLGIYSKVTLVPEGSTTVNPVGTEEAVYAQSPATTLGVPMANTPDAPEAPVVPTEGPAKPTLSAAPSLNGTQAQGVDTQFAPKAKGTQNKKNGVPPRPQGL